MLSFKSLLYGKGKTDGNLDRAIDGQGLYILEEIPQKSVLAIVGISSGSEDLSKYITEGLTSYITNNNTKGVKIVERSAMPLLEKEIDFQYSGAADDDVMVSLGKMAGANMVIAGTIYSIGSDLRFNIRIIEIETALVLASNGIDFSVDKKVKSLLNGGNVEKTLSRDNIPVRHGDGSVSKANRELRENQRRTVNGIVDFFSKDFIDRESRWSIGYSYFPDYPIGFEYGMLRNGVGFYFGMGFNPTKDSNYKFNHIGETREISNSSLGMTYPLYFDWLWLVGGIDACAVETAGDYYYYGGYYESESKTNVDLSAGIYLTFKRFYMTAKYRYFFYGDNLYNNNKHSFMLGAGICFGLSWLLL
jgi:TolB-like protein